MVVDQNKLAKYLYPKAFVQNYGKKSIARKGSRFEIPVKDFFPDFTAIDDLDA